MKSTLLRAGPLRLAYENGEVRGLILEASGIEVVRRIYAAVRDRDWGTVPMRVSNEHIEDGGDHFCVTFDARHSQGDIEFAWRGEIRGTSDGSVRFSFDGQAASTFRRNRIGFCVLHPIRECAGARARVEHADGSIEESHFPRRIAPHAPFSEIAAVSHQVEGELWARLAFGGEVFETEDQRNWIDASFKTFGTPLRLPYPVTIQAGTSVQQSVALTLQGPIPARQAAGSGAAKVQIEIGGATGKALPPLGLGAVDAALSEAQIAALQTLSLSHLRVDLRLHDFASTCRRAAAQAKALDCALEIALFVGEQSASVDGLLELAALLDELQTPMHAFLIYADNVRVAPREILLEARRILGQLGPVGSGSNANFAEFNRQPMLAEALDVVAFAANPQVHAFDDASLLETPEALPHAVSSARALYPGNSVFVSPLTLKPRFNAVASGMEREPAPGEMPPSVDARQKEPICAAWTLAVLASLARESPADSLTLFETVGARGVMDESGAFPVFELLRQLTPFRGQQVLAVTSSDAARVAALAFEGAVFVANLSAEIQRVEVEGMEAELGAYEVRKIARR